MSKIDRLFQLMQALRELPAPVQAAQLAQHMGVSARTIYRDIDALRGLGVIIDGAAGYGYTYIADHTLPPQSFTQDELEALTLGLKEVTQMGDPVIAAAAKAAHAKLMARLTQDQAHRLRYATLIARRFRAMPAPSVDVTALRAAIWSETQVRFDYIDKDGKPSSRSVEPLMIMVTQDCHCLLSWCLLRQDFRVFRLDRMVDLVVENASFRPRRIPKLREFLIAQGADPDQWT